MGTNLLIDLEIPRRSVVNNHTAGNPRPGKTISDGSRRSQAPLRSSKAESREHSSLQHRDRSRAYAKHHGSTSRALTDVNNHDSPNFYEGHGDSGVSRRKSVPCMPTHSLPIPRNRRSCSIPKRETSSGPGSITLSSGTDYSGHYTPAPSQPSPRSAGRNDGANNNLARSSLSGSSEAAESGPTVTSRSKASGGTKSKKFRCPYHFSSGRGCPWKGRLNELM